MSDSRDRDRIFERARNPRHRGVLEPADYSHEDANLACGDEIRIDIRVKGGRVAEVAFSGRGCAVSLASAAVLTELLANMTLDEAKALSEDDLLAALGVPIRRARRECALLSLAVLRAAISRAGSTPYTAFAAISGQKRRRT